MGAFFSRISFLIIISVISYTLPAVAQVRINEFMASNQTSITDERGGHADWIELWNNSDQPVNIGGWFVTDSIPDLIKHQIPVTRPDSTTIPAFGYIILWADSKKSQGVLHVDFKLDKGGEQIALARKVNNVVTLVDSITYGQQTTDVSYARTASGGWIFLAQPTPFASNGPLSMRSGISENTLAVWPNPSKGEFFCKTALEEGAYQMELINTLGHKTCLGFFSAEELAQSVKIETTQIPSGLYILQISGRNLNQSSRILIH